MRELSELRCVVLGGGGFIGTNLCRRLHKRVRSLKAFGRRQSYPAGLQGIQWMQGDFNDPTSIAAAIEGCDTVYHLVTATTPSIANMDKGADLRSNVLSTLHLLDACREAQVRRVVFVSSGGTIYGVPKQIPTPESAEPWPITAYGISKLAIERYLFLYRHLYGLEFRILRVSNPYGPYQSALKQQGVVAAFLRKAMTGQPLELWGDGAVSRDYVFIDDVTEALEAAARHEGDDKTFNIGSGVSRTLDEVIKTIGNVLEQKPVVEYYPGRAVDVPTVALDISLARGSLGWVPRTSFQDGLRKTIDWMRNFEPDL